MIIYINNNKTTTELFYLQQMLFCSLHTSKQPGDLQTPGKYFSLNNCAFIY